MIHHAIPIDRRITVTYPDVSSTLYFVACDFAIAEVHVDPEDREIWFDIFESEFSRTKTYFAARFGLVPLSVRVAATVAENRIDIEYMDALVDHLKEGV